MSSTPLLFVSQKAVESFVEDVALLWSPTINNDNNSSSSSSNHGSCPIPVLDAPPTPLEFVRDYVARSRPCLIRNALVVSPTTTTTIPFNETTTDTGSLLLDRLVQAHPDLPITVDVTPDGHGDCVRWVVVRTNEIEATIPVFVQPRPETMTLTEFARRLRSQEHSGGSTSCISALEEERTAQHWTATSKNLPQQHPCSPPIEISNRIFACTGNATISKQISPETKSNGHEADSHDDGVVYYSRQDDCLRSDTEFAPLWNARRLNDNSPLAHLPDSIDWADAAFGVAGPEAVNLWMGGTRSVSALHKDPYENLYCVVAGTKTFTLCPPCDAPFLYEKWHRSGRFVQQRTCCDDDNDDDGPQQSEAAAWQVCLDGEEGGVPWIAVDVHRRHDPDVVQQYPLLQYTHPITVHVTAGDLLYLPALWFHAVATTSDETVAVNYWYPMTFESPQWCYYSLWQQMQPCPEIASHSESSNNDNHDTRP
jgi:Cupin-like domain